MESEIAQCTAEFVRNKCGDPALAPFLISHCAEWDAYANAIHVIVILSPLFFSSIYMHVFDDIAGVA